MSTISTQSEPPRRVAEQVLETLDGVLIRGAGFWTFVSLMMGAAFVAGFADGRQPSAIWMLAFLPAVLALWRFGPRRVLDDIFVRFAWLWIVVGLVMGAALAADFAGGRQPSPLWLLVFLPMLIAFWRSGKPLLHGVGQWAFYICVVTPVVALCIAAVAFGVYGLVVFLASLPVTTLLVILILLRR